MRGWAMVVPVLSIAVCCGCAEPVLGAKQPLIDHARWRQLAEAAQGPFPEHRSASASCDPTAFGPESTYFEVNTGYCNYLDVAQPALQPGRSGDVVELLLAHLFLRSSEPAEAHVALVVNGKTLWEKYIPIPSEEMLYEEQLPLSEGFDQGSPIILHLHNHGANSWRLYSLDLRRRY